MEGIMFGALGLLLLNVESPAVESHGPHHNYDPTSGHSDTLRYTENPTQIWDIENPLPTRCWLTDEDDPVPTYILPSQHDVQDSTWVTKIVRGKFSDRKIRTQACPAHHTRATYIAYRNPWQNTDTENPVPPRWWLKNKDDPVPTYIVPSDQQVTAGEFRDPTVAVKAHPVHVPEPSATERTCYHASTAPDHGLRNPP